MNTDGSIVIGTKLDNSKLEKDLKKLNKSDKELGNEFEKTGKKGQRAAKDLDKDFNKLDSTLGDLAITIGAAFSVDKLIDFGSHMIEIASDLDEVQNVVDTAFGDMSYKVDEFASTSIESFGMSELAAKQTAGRFMAMSTALGLTQEEASQMALTVTGLSGDMASFYNVSQDIASTALASIWTGETETLKRYGIVMSQTNLEAFALANGINKSWQEMSQAEQVQLRYKYVMEQTALAQGDFAKTQDSWANQTRILDETMKALYGDIGKGLIEAFNPLLQVVNDIVTGLSNFQERTGMLDDFFVILLSAVSGLVAIKAWDIIKKVGAAIRLLGDETMIANLKSSIAAGAFGLLVTTIIRLADAWKGMTGFEQVVSVLGVVTAAALAAAVAFGAFHSAATMGIAAAGIVAGIIATTAAIHNATARIDQYEQMYGTRDIPSSTRFRSVPRAAKGAVIPPNGEFLAVYGDQHSGRNLETPEGLMRQIVREEAGGAGVLTIRPAPGLTRYLSYELEVEHNRAGSPLVEGTRR